MRLSLTATSSLPGGAAQNYNFDLRQKGLELAYVRGPGRLLFQVSNGLNQTGSGTALLELAEFAELTLALGETALPVQPNRNAHAKTMSNERIFI